MALLTRLAACTTNDSGGTIISVRKQPGKVGRLQESLTKSATVVPEVVTHKKKIKQT